MKEQMRNMKACAEMARQKMMAAKKSVMPFATVKLTEREEKIFDALNLMTEGLGFALKGIEIALSVIMSLHPRGKGN